MTTSMALAIRHRVGIRRSLNGGHREPVQAVIDPNGPIEQVTFALGAQNQALLVWRQTTKDVLRYSTSNDRGATWTTAATISGFTARPYLDKHQFDRYALLADSTGRFHLFAVGQVTTQGDLALFQMEIKDGTWSAPQIVFHGDGLPEYPRVATDGGNRIVLAFFVRDTIWAIGAYRVWWVNGTMAAPAVEPRPIPAVGPTPRAYPPDCGASPRHSLDGITTRNDHVGTTTKCRQSTGCHLAWQGHAACHRADALQRDHTSLAGAPFMTRRRARCCQSIV